MANGSSAILKVGFEIEGGWAGEAGISPFSDIALAGDPSINGQTLRDASIVATHVGEAISPPIDYREMKTEGERTRPLWADWLDTHWPDAPPPHRTNNTCGFHIHASFGSMKDYTLLTSKLFLLELRDHFMKWGKEEAKLPSKHEFWNRVGGKNTFCTLNFDATPQIHLMQKGGRIHRCRYGWLNFSWNVHGTMEFRALPTFRDAVVGVKAADTYFEFIDQWLAENRKTSLKKEFSF